MIRLAVVLAVIILGGSLAQAESEPELAESKSDPDILVRWSSSEPMVGEVRLVTNQGVEIKLADQVISIVIPWYDVRKLTASTDIASTYNGFKQRAQDTWRAHARLNRGDFRGAELIYDQLESEYLWKRGAQGADVSLGLVRCRLDRQDRVGALMPFFSLLMSSSGGSGFDESMLDGFDAQYKLLTGLPPVFGAWEQNREVGSIPDTDQISDRQRVLVEYYKLAMNAQVHRTPLAEQKLDELAGMTRGRDKRDAGVELVSDLVIAQAHPQAEKRLAARTALERRSRSNSDTWIELWARMGVGVSLLGDSSVESNEQGVIELIHVIVGLDHLSPALSVLASKIANDYLVQTNRTQWGSELMLEALNGWDANSQIQ